MASLTKPGIVIAAALLAACSSAGDGAVGERVLPDTRVVAEHFQQALAMHGPYRFQETVTPAWGGPAPPSAPSGAAGESRSFWSRFWPAAAARPAAPKPAVEKAPEQSILDHFWPPLRAAEPAAAPARASDVTPAKRAVVSAAAAPASGPPRAATGKGSGLSEVRVGVLKHAVAFGHTAKEGGIDGNVEALFVSPDWLAWAWSPRPHLGFTGNASKTNTDFLYAGLTWEWMFRDRLFIDLGLGISVHDGMLDNSMIEGKARFDRREFGCRALFREYLELGYRFLERHSLSLMWAHYSHGSLCNEENEGIDIAGLRYGLRM